MADAEENPQALIEQIEMRVDVVMMMMDRRELGG
jgi:hypothetical protein